MNILFIIYPIFVIFCLFVFIRLAPLLNLIDLPNTRKKHVGRIPVIGGIVGGFSIFIFSFFSISENEILNILVLSSIILIIGIIDDAFEINFSIRLLIQFLTIMLAIGLGFSIPTFGNYEYIGDLKLGYFTYLVTFLAILSLTNSINFIDGIDGLCAGSVLISLIGTLFFKLFFYINININFYYFIILFLVIFLFFNFNNKLKIFLGDSGSTYLGFLLSLYLINFSNQNPELHPVLILWCITLPIFDIITVTIRRLSHNKNPFLPDTSHIHHILRSLNISDFKIFLILIFVQLFLLIVGVLVFINLGADFSLFLYISLIIIYFLIVSKLSKLNA
tara:strand:- start:5570 stop:6571 length:1002 start_codon:yes stop_codon:yes gene_type:complete